MDTASGPTPSQAEQRDDGPSAAGRGPRNEAMLHLLHTRRTVPSAFLGDPGPSASELEELVTIAMRVPDHGKLTPWRFIVLDREARAILAPKLRAIREASGETSGIPIDAEKLTKELDTFQKAPVCLIVVATPGEHPKIPIWEQELSVGASTMNLMIGAHALGFSAQWLTGWSTYDDNAKRLFGVAEAEKIAGFIHIGTPVAPPTERPRPAAGDRLTRWAPDGA